MVGDVDLLITGGTVVTMDEERRLLPSGWVAVTGNRIVGVGAGDSVGTCRGARSATSTPQECSSCPGW